MNRARQIRISFCRKAVLAIVIGLLFSLVAEPCFALERKYLTEAQWGRYRQQLKYMVEGWLGYDYLEPNEDYGVWSSASVGFYARVLPKLTLFAIGTGYSRSGGDLDQAVDGFGGTLGASVFWHERFYTNTWVDLGSSAYFLPVYRVNQDFNIVFPLTSRVTMVVTPGFFFATYHEDYRLFGAFIGPAFYVSRWNGGYSLVRTEARPGRTEGWGHVFWVGHGVDGWFQTTLSTAVGDYSYQTSAVATEEIITETNIEINLNHRHWIGVNWGAFGGVSFFDLTNTYTKWGGTMGMFYEF